MVSCVGLSAKNMFEQFSTFLVYFICKWLSIKWKLLCMQLYLKLKTINQRHLKNVKHSVSHNNSLHFLPVRHITISQITWKHFMLSVTALCIHSVYNFPFYTFLWEKLYYIVKNIFTEGDAPKAIELLFVIWVAFYGLMLFIKIKLYIDWY